MRVPSPKSVVTLSYRRMFQYLVIAAAGEFPSLGKEEGYQGYLFLSGLLDFCLKDEVSKFPVINVTAAEMLPNLQLMEIVLTLQSPVFLGSEFHSLWAWQIWCISHFLSEDSVRLTVTAHSTERQREFYKYQQSFLFTELQPEGRPRRRLLTPQSHSERCSSRLTPKTEMVWL